MSDTTNAGFGQFAAGFDFLQSLAKGAAVPANFASWATPVLDVEELDKRISELKTVHFWLEQNAKAVTATVQALEVQKMTLATLKGMNINLGQMAEPFRAANLAPDKAAAPADSAWSAQASAAASPTASAQAGVLPAVADSLQLWGTLMQQFQSIVASAVQSAPAKADAVAKTSAPPSEPASQASTVARKSATAGGAKKAARRSV